MVMKSEVMRGHGPRSALQLATVLSLAAGLIVVPSQTVTASAAAKAPSKAESPLHAKSAEKVNINTAPLKDLQALPGVGMVMAQKILAGRPYASVQELRRAGVPPNTVRELMGLVTTGQTAAAVTEAAPSRAPAAHATQAPAAAAGVKTNQAPPAQKSPGQLSFFGIPIHFPWDPPPKVEAAPVEAAPAVRADEHPRPASAPRGQVPPRVTVVEPPANGMVWTDPELKLYYREGDHRYGTTKHGRFLWEDQAIREGYRMPKARAPH